jgi:hypothetical protein
MEYQSYCILAHRCRQREGAYSGIANGLIRDQRYRTDHDAGMPMPD